MLQAAIQNRKKILELSQVLLKDFNSETCLNIENIEEVLFSILLSTHQISLQEMSLLQLLEENRHPRSFISMFIC